MDDDDEDDLGALFDTSGNVRDEVPRIGHNSGSEDEENALAALDLNDLMKESRRTLFVKLLAAVKGGYATPAQENTLRQLLKDNGMVMGDPEEGKASNEERRKADLPSFSRPEYE